VLEGVRHGEQQDVHKNCSFILLKSPEDGKQWHR